MQNEIFAAPFNAETLKATGPGAPTGLKTVADVVAIFGEDYVHRGARLVIYGGATDRVIYSDINFGIDEVATSG